MNSIFATTGPIETSMNLDHLFGFFLLLASPAAFGQNTAQSELKLIQ
jgi:hypothetical protein